MSTGATFMVLVSLLPLKLQDLSALQWQNRVLILFAPASNSARLEKQLSLIEHTAASFEDRDFKVFKVAGDGPDSKALRSHFHVEESAHCLILIGKDGTEKFRRAMPVEPEMILNLVDSMPMRRAGGR